MFKLLIIADLSKKDILASTIEYLAAQDVQIDLLSIYQPKTEEAISIINLNDIIYREKVNKMRGLIESLNHLSNFFKDFKLVGKVRLGKMHNLIHDQLSKNIYDGVLFVEEIPKSKMRKFSVYKIPLFTLVKGKNSDYISFENLTPIEHNDLDWGFFYNLNTSRTKGGFKLDVPTSTTDFS